jgi:hypothetical protein
MHTLTPESVLAARLGIPRSSFSKWRSAGQLVKEQHYQHDENRAYVLTPEGEAEVLRLAGIESPPAEIARLPVVVQAAGALPRMLRVKLPDGGMATVRLTAPRVFASQFRRNDPLDVLPTEHPGIFEFDGPKPRRIRI